MTAVCATGGSSQALLLLAGLLLTVAEIALEKAARLDRGAAAHLAQEAAFLKLVEVAMDGHLRHAKARGKVIDTGRAGVHQKIHDALPPAVAFHA